MAYTPYDWQQTLRQKADYAEDRLRGGSPVVALSCEEGILLLTTRRTQRKIFEIYDRLAFAGLGTPSDLEAVRQRAVDFTHAEGYQRSPEDVSIQRVVGFAISPLLKRSFADPLRTPLVLRGLFAQLGKDPEGDLFMVLGYDGEFTSHRGRVGVAGADVAERGMERVLAGGGAHETSVPTLDQAMEIALDAWAAGPWALEASGIAPEEEANAGAAEERLPSRKELRRVLAERLRQESLEAAVLERDTARERRLRALSREELEPYLPSGA